MTYIVRKVLANEYPKYTAHLKALDPESRMLRFGFCIKDDSLDNLCKTFEVNTKDHILFCVENNELDFIAIGHIALGNEMELAFSVLKEYQGQGLGDKLMKRCIRYCRTRKILKGNMVCLSYNTAIKHLCTKNQIQFHNDHGETEANIHFDEPRISTYIDEGLAVHAGMTDYAGKRAMLPWTIMSKTLDNMLK